MFSARLGFMRPDSVPAGGRPWVPSDITSATVAAWFDTYDISNVLSDNGTTCSKIIDQSSKNVGMEMVSEVNQPDIITNGQNGLPVLRFTNAKQQFMTTPKMSSTVLGQAPNTDGNLFSYNYKWNQHMTMFTMVKPSIGSTAGDIWCIGYGGDRWTSVAQFHNAPQPLRAYERGDQGEATNILDLSSNQDWQSNYYTGLIIENQKHMSMMKNGDTIGSVSDIASLLTSGDLTKAMDNIALGCRNRITRGAGHVGAFFEGDLQALVMIMGELNESDRQKLEGWGHHSSGIENLLPMDHPYRTSPPEIA